MSDGRITINLDLAGYNFKVPAKTAEEESIIRQAAQEINESIESYESRYPDKKGNMAFLMAALDISVKKITVERNSIADSSPESLLRMEQDLDEALSL